GRAGPAQAIHSEAILAGSVLGLTQIGVCHHLEPDIPYGRGERHRTLARGKPLLVLPDHGEVDRHEGRDPPEPALVRQALSQDLRLSEMLENPVEFSEWEQRTPNAEPQIN